MQEPLPSGAYVGQVSGVSIRQFAPSAVYGPDDDGRRVQFDIRVFPKGRDAVDLSAFASPKWSPKSKLFAWVSSLTGSNPNVFKEPDLEVLVGAECQVMLKVSEDGYYNRVEALLPMPG